MSERLPLPKACRELGCLVAEYHGHCHRAFELRPETVLKVLERADAFRRPARFEQFLIACEADARGRTGLEHRDYPQADYLRGALTAVTQIDLDDIKSADGDGAKIGAEIRKRRVAALRRYKADYDPPK